MLRIVACGGAGGPLHGACNPKRRRRPDAEPDAELHAAGRRRKTADSGRSRRHVTTDDNVSCTSWPCVVFERLGARGSRGRGLPSHFASSRGRIDEPMGRRRTLAGPVACVWTLVAGQKRRDSVDDPSSLAEVADRSTPKVGHCGRKEIFNRFVQESEDQSVSLAIIRHVCATSSYASAVYWICTCTCTDAPETVPCLHPFVMGLLWRTPKTLNYDSSNIGLGEGDGRRRRNTQHHVRTNILSAAHISGQTRRKDS